jgi:signal transduction histidine kinase
VAFSLSTEANCLVLRVRDEGIGIPARDQARLFEPFHRAHNVVNISGTGLGLAIVYKAVTLHGGVVHCTSEEGEGTEFVVNIPLER